ncbi:MAG: hypothetical protein HRU76_05770 [Phycisphaeraceae bacterium]|nr:hypothetical protein [Phycisphaerales bacterium]QOJ17110.1 MAG: hypothetical protein HRU76_05770 [Phycisphaeraceae bacterium]
MFHVVHPTRRGLTLIELMLALTITVMISGAIASMMAAIAAGVETRQDVRGTMVRASAASGRLGAYVAGSRCILSASATDLVLWLRDSRESGTVHASEVRWILYDPAGGGYDVLYVRFPDEWTDLQCDQADQEYAANADWNAVLNFYDDLGYVAMTRLVDGLESVEIAIDHANPLSARLASFLLSFAAESGAQQVRVSESIRLHEPPVK